MLAEYLWLTQQTANDTLFRVKCMQKFELIATGFYCIYLFVYFQENWSGNHKTGEYG